MKEKYIGIDIGTDNIKIAEITKNRNTIVISNSKILKTPRFLVQDGRIADEGELLDLLKKALSPIKARKAIVILNDSLVITRDIEMPEASEKELEKMIKLDASEYLPDDIEEYTIKYRVLISSKENPKNNNYILMTTIKTELAMDFYRVIRKLGLKPIAIDVTINSMIKYFKWNTYSKIIKLANEKTIAMLDIGASTVKLVIFHEGIPKYQQIMKHSSQKIDILIANSLNVEREEAEAYKIKYGLKYLYEEAHDELSRTVGQIINEQIDLMLREVYTHLQSYTARGESRSIGRMWLTGGVARMQGLKDYIGDSLSIPCRVLEQNHNVRFSEEKNIKEDSNKLEYFTNIVGAAFRGE